MTAAVLITGAPAAGKSAVLDALATLLEIEGAAHGAIETEELTRGAPPLGNEELAAQLQCVIELQRAAGRSLFLIAFTAESAAQLRATCDAVGVERTLVVALSAPAELLATRIAAREPERWPGKPGLIAHARELAPVAPSLAGVELTIDTAARDPEDVAREVLAAMRSRGLLAARRSG